MSKKLVDQEDMKCVCGWIRNIIQEEMLSFKVQHIPLAIIFLFAQFVKPLVGIDFWCDSNNNKNIGNIKLTMHNTICNSIKGNRISCIHGKRIININNSQTSKYIWILKYIKSTTLNFFYIGLQDLKTKDHFCLTRDGYPKCKDHHRCYVKNYYSSLDTRRLNNNMIHCTTKEYGENDQIKIKMYINHKLHQFDIEFHKNKTILFEFRAVQILPEIDNKYRLIMGIRNIGSIKIMKCEY